MNPLTLVKRIQNINSKEAALGISDDASWHAKYKDSSYVFVGGIPFDLTEGDLLAVFAQYGEIVDVNLVRDKGTGKSKGFAFVAYEDQRSTILAVDNLNGAQILGRVIRVDHVTKYKKKEEEDEKMEQQKREARGVCRAFQRGECNRGAGCKFSHDEHRARNTGWGPKEDRDSRWGHDKYEGSMKSGKKSGNTSVAAQEGLRVGDKDARSSRAKGSGGTTENHHKPIELSSRDLDVSLDKKSEKRERQMKKEDKDQGAMDYRSQKYDHESKHDYKPNTREGDDRRKEKRSKRHDDESYHQEDRDNRTGERGSAYVRDSSSHRHGGKDEDRHYRSRR